MSTRISKTAFEKFLEEDKLNLAKMEVKENKRLIKAEFEIMPPKESILEKILHEMKTMKVEIKQINTRIDDLSNDFNNRFDKLEARVEALDKRVTVLEEKAK